MDAASPERFFTSLPAFTDFEGVTHLDLYRPLPAGWQLAACDIVESTKAIAEGRYKAVNMAGASVISAVLNALGGFTYPFVFGGDGAIVAVPGPSSPAVEAALAAARTWVAEELGLDLRTALVPVADIRAAGLDVRVARFQVAPKVSYAMFAGGGASWAEREMKAGRYGVAAATPGTKPDLSGLSCRWNPVQSRHGEILSIIAMPGPARDPAAFQALVDQVVALTGREERGGHPLAAAGPETRFLAGNTDYEARAGVRRGLRWAFRLWVIAQFMLLWVLDRANTRLGGFDARLYRRDLAQNSDFRKFDDGLKMTVDLDAGRIRQIEELLESASGKGICRYGLHRQRTALMTCLVPTTPFQRDHMHFIDGGAGGYATAASKLKGLA